MPPYEQGRRLTSGVERVWRIAFYEYCGAPRKYDLEAD
jgi:hypothetical protein